MSVLIPGARAVLEVAGRVFTDLTNLIQLTAFTVSGGPVATFRKPGTTSGYQVPASKSFNMLAINATHRETASTNVRFALVYSDNDASIASTATWTNPVYYQLVNTGTSFPFIASAEAFGAREYPLIGWTTPTTKYAGFFNELTATGISIRAYGYEV